MTARFFFPALVGVLCADAGALALAQTTPAPATVHAPPSSLASQVIDTSNGLSLDRAIAQALEAEPSLRAARAEIDIARGARQQAALRPSPSVSFERREEPGGSDNQTMVGVEWPLDLFRQRGRTIVAEREVTAIQLEVADRTRRLAGEVRQRYGEVLAAVRDVTVLDELVGVTTRQAELMRARAQEGATPPLERDLIEVEVRRLEADRLLYVARVESAMFELKRVLGMEPFAALALRDSLEQLVLDAASSRAAPAEAAVVEQRPDVRASEARLGIADAKVERAQREGRFDVSLFGGYMRMDSGFPQFGLNAAGSPERVRGVFHYATGGARITLPLFNRHQGEIAAARAERAAASAKYDGARLGVKAELAIALARDQRAHEAVAIYRTSVQARARQNLTVVGQSYELGRATVFDVLAEQRRYLDVERAYAEALRTAYEARTALGLAIGVVR